jgi:excisionase family DNA binding protein
VHRLASIDQLPPIISLKVVAKALGCSTRTLRRAIDAGELRASRLAMRGCWVVQREDLVAWVDARANVAARPITPLAGNRQANASLRRRVPMRAPLSAKLKDLGTVA